MSDSESDNEYAALLRKNFERKQALFAELGLNNLLNESKQLFSQTRERDKPRKRVRRKSALAEMPSRRSIRIQKKSNTVKYVKGFLGFDDSYAQELLNDNQLQEPTYVFKNRTSNSQDVEDKCIGFLGFDDSYDQELLNDNRLQEPTNVFKSRTSNSQDVESCHGGDHNEGESENPENKNESDVHAGEIATDQNTSLEVVNKTKAVPDQKKIDRNGTPNKDTCGFTPGEPGVHEASVVKISDLTSETKSRALHKENIMETVDKPCILNDNNNYSNELEFVEDNQSIEWDDRSEEISKQIILKHYQRSVQVKKRDNEDTDSEDDWSNYKNVMFCISASENSDDSDDVDDSNDKVPRSRRRVYHPKFCYDVPTVLCEDVTEDMLANIAKRSSCKVYDQLNGTTCHQCRQKTLDTKTVCRSGRCVGVRGMFCGICLPKRYGEQVADALKNPNWECPVCRGICNCSFCRARAGKIPTGILYPEARQQGYNCVAEYLKDKYDKDDKENISTKEKKLKILKC